MNLLSISDESAASRGVDVHRTQRLAFLSASLATGAAVSLGGPVGFIGIVIPHLVRLHRRRRSSPRAARVGVRRRRVSRHVRHHLAHGAVAARSAGRRHHRHHRRTILPMAAHKKSLALVPLVLLAWFLLGALVVRPGPATAHHLAHPLGHRDAVRDGRRTARGRRRQLRSVSSRGADQAEGRRPHRSRYRAHPLAQARSRSSSTERRPISARRWIAPTIPMFLYEHAGLAGHHHHHPRARPARGQRDGCERAGGPHRSVDRRHRAGASQAGRGRERCWCSVATRKRCAAFTPAAGLAFCTTCSTPPAARTSSPTSNGRAFRPRASLILARAPDVIVEVGIDTASAQRRNLKRLGRARVGPSRAEQTHLSCFAATT